MNIEVLIKSHLEGSITDLESKELGQWITSDPFHKEVFLAYEKKWLQVQSVKKANLEVECEIVEAPSVLDIAQIRTKRQAAKWQRSLRNANPLLKYGGFAAGLLLVTLSLFFSMDKNPNLFLSADPDGIRTMDISETSKLWINSNGEISFKKHFNNRVIYVDGEVYFELDEEEPITIISNDLEITASYGNFNVCSYLNKKEAEICVSKGRIDVDAVKVAGQNKILLKKGHKLMYDTALQLLQPSDNHDANFSSWCTRELVFEDTKVEMIAYNIEKYFGKPVTITNPRINVCTFSGKFSLENPNRILLAVAEELDLTFNETKTCYSLKGEGCGVDEAPKYGY